MACACGGTCSSCASYFQAAIDQARECIACLGEDGLVTGYSTEVKVVTRTWSGGKPGLGTVTESVVTLTPRPKVSSAEPRYVADHMGKQPQGRRLVENVSLTYTEDDLADYDLTEDQERYYLLNDKPYRLDTEPVQAGLGWRFRLSRMKARPPAP